MHEKCTNNTTNIYFWISAVKSSSCRAKENTNISRESFPKIFDYSVLTQTETESNWYNIALAATEAHNRPCKYIHIGVYIIVFSNKTSFHITFWTMELL